MELNTKYPEINDLRRAAKRRLPKFVWEYLDSGTGTETTAARNRTALDRIGFAPSILHGEIDVDLSTSFLGQDHPLPVGFAPVGMSGLIWPGAERFLATAAAQAGIPFCLSTVASQAPEDLAPHLGDHGWFQLYPPRDVEIRKDSLARARDAGFKVLVLTADVPVASRRERLLRSGLTQPPRLTPRLMAQVALRPAWALATARAGMPRMRMLEKYTDKTQGAMSSTAHAGYLLRTAPDWAYVDWLRDHWDGPLVVKGVLRAGDAPRLQQAGVDALWVSNHAGRQFDAVPAAIDALPAIRAATDLPLIYDSGIAGGLDILRAFAKGADFVMLGRAAHYGVAALGEIGPGHLLSLLEADLRANMGQLGATSLHNLPATVPLW
ncbi:MAG: alpha-hydroxy-acid oxidizing protein [Rhodobacteraceae bacterium]|nr:alpha-hydroxy-acid oxidizing protein [Paracoccaceae bacterium]